ncbi:segregation and condensation protein A [Mycoplasmoides fastidiosum]|uniref:dihydrofolate reductase n=1 Tax=Mycoplasmoides fastidiosum TaxID=92758 RepID=A0ABU0LZM1_9BACT|nr:segregation/condensation protein A [Mycoplasmoides fastidiosum]MDQ0514144.1 segregation and condensation protein A [Mycoplasmoides fastidiosum]UUD37448.1 segregation/condensation protein A [Mycoplasmoides fastidiosum]
MAIKLIWCQDQNGGIGKNNQLPWNLPQEMQHFRDTTLHQIIVMGRKTFESIGKPLPKRTNVVLTRDPNFQATGVEVFHDVQSVLKKYEGIDLYIIGGSEIYRTFFGLADELIISQLPTSYDCDTFLNFDLNPFELIHTKDFLDFQVHYYHYVKKNDALELNLKNFIGPLDLLWVLIREKKYDIHDLDLKALIEQYLKFIKEQLHRIDLDLAADYLLTSAQLISLKTKMIFATDENATTEQIQDFLAEKQLLIQRLIEYRRIRKGISWMRKKQRERTKVFIKKPDFFDDANAVKTENLYLPKSIDVRRLKQSLEIALEKMQMRNLKKQQLSIRELSVDEVTLELANWLITQRIKESSFLTYLKSLEPIKRTLQYITVVFLVILTQVRNQFITIEIQGDDILFAVTDKWDLKYE